MNTDKIYAEQIANEYDPRTHFMPAVPTKSNVVAMRKSIHYGL